MATQQQSPSAELLQLLNNKCSLSMKLLKERLVVHRTLSEIIRSREQSRIEEDGRSVASSSKSSRSVSSCNKENIRPQTGFEPSFNTKLDAASTSVVKRQQNVLNDILPRTNRQKTISTHNNTQSVPSADLLDCSPALPSAVASKVEVGPPAYLDTSRMTSETDMFVEADDEGEDSDQDLLDSTMLTDDHTTTREEKETEKGNLVASLSLISRLRAQLSLAHEELAASRLDLERLPRLEAMNAQLSRERASVSAELEKIRLSLDQERRVLNDFGGRVESLENQVQEKDQEVSMLRADNASYRQRNAELEVDLSHSRAEVDRLVFESMTVQNALNDETCLRIETQKENGALQEKQLALSSELDSSKRVIEQRAADLTSKQRSLDAAEERGRDLEKEVSNLKGQLSGHSQLTVSAKQMIEHLHENLKEERLRRKQAEQVNEKLRLENHRAKKELDTLSDVITSMDLEWKTLEDAYNDVRAVNETYECRIESLQALKDAMEFEIRGLKSTETVELDQPVNRPVCSVFTQTNDWSTHISSQVVPVEAMEAAAALDERDNIFELADESVCESINSLNFSQMIMNDPTMEPIPPRSDDTPATPEEASEHPLETMDDQCDPYSPEIQALIDQMQSVIIHLSANLLATSDVAELDDLNLHVDTSVNRSHEPGCSFIVESPAPPCPSDAEHELWNAVADVTDANVSPSGADPLTPSSLQNGSKRSLSQQMSELVAVTPISSKLIQQPSSELVKEAYYANVKRLLERLSANTGSVSKSERSIHKSTPSQSARKAFTRSASRINSTICESVSATSPADSCFKSGMNQTVDSAGMQREGCVQQSSKKTPLLVPTLSSDLESSTIKRSNQFLSIAATNRYNNSDSVGKDLSVVFKIVQEEDAESTSTRFLDDLSEIADSKQDCADRCVTDFASSIRSIVLSPPSHPLRTPAKMASSKCCACGSSECFLCTGNPKDFASDFNHLLTVAISDFVQFIDNL
eukprot:GILK01013961.1.p1 GENE.GILK01013961.1~~GILK01013961.1.p1  ORF type:complete len:998 (+),score=231.97 GILK01013961.1:41-2995(+)